MGLDLSIKVLSKTLDMTKLTPEKIEVATLTRENGKTQIKILPADQVDELIKKYEKARRKLRQPRRRRRRRNSRSHEQSLIIDRLCHVYECDHLYDQLTRFTNVMITFV